MKANKIFNKKHTYSFLALSVMAVCGQASATIYEKMKVFGDKLQVMNLGLHLMKKVNILVMGI